MKNFFRKLFGITAAEIRGLTLLASVLMLVLLVPRLGDWLAPGRPLAVSDRQQLDSLVAILEARNQPLQPALFSFNPNTVTYDSLLLLGFEPGVAGRLLRYRQAGGFFHTPDDVLRIYGIDTGLVSRLTPYMLFPAIPAGPAGKSMAHTPVSRPAAGHTGNEPPRPSFDLNRADTTTLKTIYGIGPVLSQRIVRYRERLGGFVSPGQLYEVYRLDSAVVERLLARSYIDPSFRPRPLYINRLPADLLAAHPYLSWRQARLLAAYREQHGAFGGAADLLRVYGMDSLTVQRLLPYLDWSVPE